MKIVLMLNKFIIIAELRIIGAWELPASLIQQTPPGPPYMKVKFGTFSPQPCCTLYTLEQSTCSSVWDQSGLFHSFISIMYWMLSTKAVWYRLQSATPDPIGGVTRVGTALVMPPKATEPAPPPSWENSSLGQYPMGTKSFPVTSHQFFVFWSYGDDNDDDIRTKGFHINCYAEIDQRERERDNMTAN